MREKQKKRYISPSERGKKKEGGENLLESGMESGKREKAQPRLVFGEKAGGTPCCSEEEQKRERSAQSS